jgi:hypothetical protein
MSPDYEPDRIARLTVTTPAARADEGLETALYFEMVVINESGEKYLILAESLEHVATFVRDMAPPTFNIVAGPES